MIEWLRNTMKRLYRKLITSSLGLIMDRLEAIERKVDELMGVAQDIKDLAAKIDAATTAVATRLETLLQRVTNGMSDAEVADVKSQLQAEADRLTVMGRDPNNPVPPTP